MAYLRICAGCGGDNHIIGDYCLTCMVTSVKLEYVDDTATGAADEGRGWATSVRKRMPDKGVPHPPD